MFSNNDFTIQIGNSLNFLIFLRSFHLLFNLYYKINEIALWYLLHFLGNIWIVILCFHPIKELMNDPLLHLFNPTPYYDSTFAIITLHLYHLLFFKCTKGDIFHHFVFVGIGSFTIYYINNGYYAPLSHFFICGLPGGIDYFLLFLYKTDYISKDTRLKYALVLNLWIRSPGLCMLSTFALINFIYNEKNMHTIFELILQVSMTMGNGQMYLRDIIYTSGQRNI